MSNILRITASGVDERIREQQNPYKSSAAERDFVHRMNVHRRIPEIPMPSHQGRVQVFFYKLM
jgi:hypothetical protein